MQALAIVGSLLAGAVSLWGCGGGDAGTTAKPGEGEKGSVQDVWDNHLTAFVNFKVDDIMKDYDELSTIATFNDDCEFNPDQSNSYAVHKGKVAIKLFFENLFAQLNKTDTNIVKVGPKSEAPVVKEGEGGAFNANVFLTWRTINLDKEIDYATDSFSFRKSGEIWMIDYQTIVTTEPSTTCVDGKEKKGAREGTDDIYAAWQHHLDAFSAKETDDIMSEYDDNSIVQVFDNRDESYSVFTGPTDIKGMFTDLFQAIEADQAENGTDIKIGLLEIDPTHNSVFLVWKSNSHPRATDTFIFNGKMIARQNIVVTTKEPVAAEHGMLV